MANSPSIMKSGHPLTGSAGPSATKGNRPAIARAGISGAMLALSVAPPQAVAA